MLGAGHFKKKIAKKERKAAAKLAAPGGKKPQASAEQGDGDAVRKPTPSAQAAAAAKPKTRNYSTLKGPVVNHPVRAVRDVANDRKGVAFANKFEEKAYLRRHHQLPGAQQQQQGKGGAAATSSSSDAASKPHGADSKAHRRQLQKKRTGEDLLDSFRTKLQSSTFRLLNEQIYSSPNAFAGQLLREKATFDDYHNGYRLQLAQWPMNPNELIIESLLKDKRGRFLANKSKSMPGYIPPSWVICDLGCGDALIAQALKPKGYTVHSFDFCANNEHVVVADASHVPLESASVDICIFSLSLMATDYFDNLLEAYRVLKPKRLLKIVEVRSRIPNPNAFASLVEGIGFVCDWYDVAGDYFIAFDFIKDDGEKGPNTQPVQYPGDVLLPSLYKKR